MAWVHADWTWPLLSPLLDADDLSSLALCALEARHRSLWRFLVYEDSSARKPIDGSRMFYLAVASGCWRAATTIHHELLSHRHAQRNGENASSDLSELQEQLTKYGLRCSPSMVSLIRRVHYSPVELPPQVVYEACRRGRLDAVVWLHQASEYDPHIALEWAAKGKHTEVVRWLLTNRKTAQSLHQEIKISWTLKGKDAKLLGGFYAWNVSIPEERAVYGYCASREHGLLPRKNLKSLKMLYPLKSWAGLEGNLELLEKLHENHCGRDLSTSEAVVRAAESGHLGIVQWFFEIERPIAKVIEDVTFAALARGYLDIVEWLYEEDYEIEIPIASRLAVRAGGFSRLDEWLNETFPDPKLLSKIQRERALPWQAFVVEAAGNGLLDVVRFLVEDVGCQVPVRAIGEAAANGHFDVVEWLMVNHRPDDNDLRYVLTRAVSGGNVPIVRWLVSELGLWDSELVKFAAVENRLNVVEYLYSVAQTRAADSNLPVPTIVDLTIDLVYLIAKGFFDVLEWLLNTVRESVLVGQDLEKLRFFLTLERYYDENESALGVRSAEFDYTRRHYQWTLVARQPRHRVVRAVQTVVASLPTAACLRLSWLPEWAVKTSSFDTLNLLATVGHPDLYTDDILCLLLQSTCDPSLVQWFVQKDDFASVVEDHMTKIIQWAAKHNHIDLLQLLYSRSEELSTFRTAAWTGAKHGHLTVLQSVLRYLDSHGLTAHEGFCLRIWQSVDAMAAENGHTNVIDWLWTNISTKSPLSKLAVAAAKRGHLRVLQWLQTTCKGPVPISTRGCCRAVGNGHTEVVSWLLRHQPDIIGKASEIYSELDGTVESLLTEWKIN